MAKKHAAYANDEAYRIVVESADSVEAVAACLDCLADSEEFEELHGDKRGDVLRMLASALRTSIQPTEEICPSPES